MTDIQKGGYVTFLTLGIANDEYIDVTVKKLFGHGTMMLLWKR